MILIIILHLFINISLYSISEKLNDNLLLMCNDKFYSFEFEVDISYDKEYLLKYIFNYSTLKEISDNKRIKCTLIYEDNNLQSISYRFHYLICKSEYNYDRELCLNEGLIKFYLTSSYQNLKFIPYPEFSDGYYKIFKRDNKTILGYYQETILNQKISNIHLFYLKREILEFYKSFLKAIEGRLACSPQN